MVGGSPCIDGTRLTCANVAQSLRYESVDEYLRDYPHLTPADIRNCLEYCSRRQCIEDEVINFCQQCTLDTRRDPDPDDSPEEIWLLAETLLMNRKSNTRSRD
ncbi:DUF433 domain-containing protein [Lignipirellula cremea]|uniref:DUF433 domain-containing protein n=1 Tax=Lignipirellula cremea TaxID=2528010 RepID=A0A518DS71_9BACT|nr:hypothetical protein Pla8534_24900 [Lignipirellula cremea]